MERALLLDVVVRERPAVLELLARKDEPLLVRRNALLVLDLGLDVVDRVGRLNLERDRLAGEAAEGAEASAMQRQQTAREEDRGSGQGGEERTHVLTKICIPPRRRRTRCSVDSF